MLPHIHSERERERERERDRQTDRETDRQTERETERQGRVDKEVLRRRCEKKEIKIKLLQVRMMPT